MMFNFFKKFYRSRFTSDALFIPFAGALAFQILFIALPVLLLFLIACTVWPSHIFSLSLLRALSRVMGRSLFLAFLTSSICALVAYPLSFFIVNQRPFIKTLLIFLLLLPFWTNFLLHILAWFFVLERTGFLNNLLIALSLIDEPIQFLNSYGAIVVMMIYYYMPFMILPLFAVLERFDQRLIEASLDLGATWWQTFKKIIVPLTQQGFMTGFFLVFIPSFGEFAIPELMGGDKNLYIGSAISYTMLHPDTQSFGIVFSLISCVVLGINCFFLWLSFQRLQGQR